MLMLKKTRHIAVAATLFALVLPLSLFADSRRLARTSAGSVIDVLGTRDGRHEQAVDGYVRSVRNGGRDIALISHYGAIDVVADRSTAVFYQGRRYRTDDLERGDRVRVFGDFERETIYAQSIEVLRSVSDVPGSGTRGETHFRGTVTSIDQRSAAFEIRTFDGRRVWVDPRAEDRSGRRDIERLRVGDQVSVDGTFDRSGTFIASFVDTDSRIDREHRRDSDDERDRRFDRRRHHDDDDDDNAENDEDDD
jgi:uncharacterized protein DUF5666